MGDKSFFEEEIDDSTDTDTSTDSNNAPFESSPYILDVHEISKDENKEKVPSPNQPDTQMATGQAAGQVVKQKLKKTRKKKKKTPSQATVSSESASEVSVPAVAAVVEEPAKEEFYDAHGSYHTITQNPAAVPVMPPAVIATAALPAPGAAQGAVVTAGHVPEPKTDLKADSKIDAKANTKQGTVTPHSQGQRTSKTPSVIAKPIEPPD